MLGPTTELSSQPAGRFLAAAMICLSASFVSTKISAAENKAAKIFKKCSSCHVVGKAAENRVGPQLNGLAGRKFGGLEGYKYSKAMRKAGETGQTWDAETLDAFLKKPRAYLKGTRMGFSGLKKDEQRKILIDWLLHFDSEGNTIVEDSKVTLASAGGSALLGSSAAAIEGDPEYGAYLSGECVTCHKAAGGDDGIPSIVGWPKENFIHALYEYKNEVRENPVMRTVTKRLGDEEMAALAAYFGSINVD